MPYENGEEKEKMKSYYMRKIAILKYQILKKQGSLINLEYALKTLLEGDNEKW